MPNIKLERWRHMVSTTAGLTKAAILYTQIHEHTHTPPVIMNNWWPKSHTYTLSGLTLYTIYQIVIFFDNWDRNVFAQHFITLKRPLKNVYLTKSVCLKVWNTSISKTIIVPVVYNNFSLFRLWKSFLWSSKICNMLSNIFCGFAKPSVFSFCVSPPHC